MSSLRILDGEQRTPEWYSARAGRVTGSVADCVTATIKTGEAAARRDLRYRLAIEQITGQPLESGGFVSAEMQRGIDREPDARARLEAETGLVVRTTGFIYDDQRMVGCSLDGDVNDLAGIVELKCPKPSTHIRYLTAGKLPAEYIDQVRHNLVVTGAQWCLFASFDDRLPAGLDWFCVRVSASDLDLDGYRACLSRFLADVDDLRASLLALRPAA